MRVLSFDHDFVAEVVERLGRLSPDARPGWGRMKADDLVPHLVRAVKYSMGRGPRLPFIGNWLTRRVVGPLILHGIVPVPKNVKLPGPQEPFPPEQGDLETLHAVLEEYLNLVQADELRPAVHPLFGDIGVDGWARMHVVHFEHHLRQFGL